MRFILSGSTMLTVNKVEGVAGLEQYKEKAARYNGLMKRLAIIFIFLIIGAGAWYYFYTIDRKDAQERTVKLFYYVPGNDTDENGNSMCSRNGLVPTERKIPITQTPIQDTIRLLLSGELTDEERVRGISTEYPLEGFSLNKASLDNGVLTLEFNDQKNKTVGGACRVGILWFQIEATAKQFPEVQEVRFLPEEIFQP